MDSGKKAISKKVNCPYCGNNPVPHFIFWYDESLNVLFTPIRQKILYNSFTNYVKKRRYDQKFWKALLYFGIIFKIVKKQNHSENCKTRRAQVLWEEAKNRNIEMCEFLFFGKSIDVYEAKKNGKSIIFSGLPRPLGYTNKNLDLMDDKAFLKKLFLKNSLPVPQGSGCRNLTQAEGVFNKIDKPVIVKPQLGSRGRHSTTFVNSVNDLKKAFFVAKQLCYWAVVEEQLFGPVYRATVVDFKLAGVLKGEAPKVIGDGVKTIKQLVEVKNNLKLKGVKDVEIGIETEKFVSRQNLNLTSVPKAGDIVYLSEKIGVNYGGSSSEDLEICHPDNKEIFEKAAKILGDPIVGFDFIIEDVSKSWTKQKCGFIEANSLPFINLHHDPLLGKPQNVAAKIWDTIYGF